MTDATIRAELATLVICGGLVLQRPFPPRSSRSHEHDTGEGDMSQTDAEFVEMMAARARRQYPEGVQVVDHELERLVALAHEALEHRGCIEKVQADQLAVAERDNELHGEKDAFIATLRQQLIDAEARVRELEEALEDVRQRGRLADHSHWDAQGNAGRTCPVCVEQVIVRERVRDALARRTP